MDSSNHGNSGDGCALSKYIRTHFPDFVQLPVADRMAVVRQFNETRRLESEIFMVRNALAMVWVHVCATAVNGNRSIDHLLHHDPDYQEFPTQIFFCGGLRRQRC